MNEKQLKLMQWASKELKFGCLISMNGRLSKIVEVHEQHFFTVNNDDLYDDDDEGAYYNELRVRGLEFGEANLEQDYRGDINDIIGHLYGRERLEYLGIFARAYKKGKDSDEYRKITSFVYSSPKLLLLPCTERPPELIDLTLQFLESLPEESKTW